MEYCSDCEQWCECTCKPGRIYRTYDRLAYREPYRPTPIEPEDTAVITGDTPNILKLWEVKNLLGGVEDFVEMFPNREFYHKHEVVRFIALRDNPRPKTKARRVSLAGIVFSKGETRIRRKVKKGRKKERPVNATLTKIRGLLAGIR